MGTNLVNISEIQGSLIDPEKQAGAVYIITDNGNVVIEHLNCQNLLCIDYNGLITDSQQWFVPGLSNEAGAVTSFIIMNTSEIDPSEITVVFHESQIRRMFTLQPLGSIEISTAEISDEQVRHTVPIFSFTIGVNRLLRMFSRIFDILLNGSG